VERVRVPKRKLLSNNGKCTDNYPGKKNAGRGWDQRDKKRSSVSHLWNRSDLREHQQLPGWITAQAAQGI